MKKESWKTVIQIVVSVLSAILTTLTTTSCMGHGPFLQTTTLKQRTDARNLRPPFFLLRVKRIIGPIAIRRVTHREKAFRSNAEGLSL